jgi:hypothetical protein
VPGTSGFGAVWAQEGGRSLALFDFATELIARAERPRMDSSNLSLKPLKNID